jgi:hypothetical protein
MSNCLTDQLHLILTNVEIDKLIQLVLMIESQPIEDIKKTYQYTYIKARLNVNTGPKD